MALAKLAHRLRHRDWFAALRELLNVIKDAGAARERPSDDAGQSAPQVSKS